MRKLHKDCIEEPRVPYHYMTGHVTLKLYSQHPKTKAGMGGCSCPCCMPMIGNLKTFKVKSRRLLRRKAKLALKKDLTVTESGS